MLLAAGFFISKNNSKKENKQTVMVEKKPTSMLTFTPTPSPIVLRKSLYTIAIFGDSMVDTMGENLEYLQKILSHKYPNT